MITTSSGAHTSAKALVAGASLSFGALANFENI